MAVSYRVFRMEIRVGKEGGDLAELGPGGKHRELLLGVFQRDLGQVRLWGDELSKQGERLHRRSITIEAAAADWDEHLIHIECGIGREGLHDAARAPGKADLAIHDRAAESPRHVTIVLPKAKSGVCLLVVEAESNADARSRIEWLVKGVSAQARREAKGKGRPPKLMPSTRQIADPAHVGEMLDAATRIAARFDARHADGLNGTEVDVSRRQLTVALAEGDRGQKWLAKKLKAWTGAGTSVKDAMKELNLLLMDEERGKYDEVDFVVTAGAKHVTIALEELLEQSFSYGLGDIHPTLDRWFERVYEKTNELARLAKTDCRMPAPSALDDLKEELATCRIDSLSAVSEEESTEDFA